MDVFRRWQQWVRGMVCIGGFLCASAVMGAQEIVGDLAQLQHYMNELYEQLDAPIRKLRGLHTQLFGGGILGQKPLAVDRFSIAREIYDIAVAGKALDESVKLLKEAGYTRTRVRALIKYFSPKNAEYYQLWNIHAGLVDPTQKSSSEAEEGSMSS